MHPICSHIISNSTLVYKNKQHDENVSEDNEDNNGIIEWKVNEDVDFFCFYNHNLESFMRIDLH